MDDVLSVHVCLSICVTCDEGAPAIYGNFILYIEACLTVFLENRTSFNCNSYDMHVDSDIWLCGLCLTIFNVAQQKDPG